MTDRQMDDIAYIITEYASSVEDLERIQSLIDCLIEQYKEEMEER